MVCLGTKRLTVSRSSSFRMDGIASRGVCPGIGPRAGHCQSFRATTQETRMDGGVGVEQEVKENESRASVAVVWCDRLKRVGRLPLVSRAANVSERERVLGSALIVGRGLSLGFGVIFSGEGCPRVSILSLVGAPSREQGAIGVGHDKVHLGIRNGGSLACVCVGELVAVGGCLDSGACKRFPGWADEPLVQGLG